MLLLLWSSVTSPPLTSSTDNLEVVSRIWRQQGSITKLYNMIRYIRANPQRRKEFGSVVIGKEWWQ